MTKTKTNGRYLSFDRAVMLMHHKGTRLTKMHTPNGLHMR
jgi:hypothetical protein